MQTAMVRDARQPRVEFLANVFPDCRAHAILFTTQATATAKAQSGRFRRKDAAK
jgi:hypothetical protein